MGSSNTKKILMIVGGVVLLVVILCAGGAYAIYALVRSSTAASEKVVDNFNTNYNTKDYQAIFNDFHPQLQQVIPLDKLTHMLDYMHEKNGRFVSASGTGWYVNTQNGVTAVDLNYSVEFANDKGAEEFTLVELNGRPVITRFNIETPNLAGYSSPVAE